MRRRAEARARAKKTLDRLVDVGVKTLTSSTGCHLQDFRLRNVEACMRHGRVVGHVQFAVVVSGSQAEANSSKSVYSAFSTML